MFSLVNMNKSAVITEFVQISLKNLQEVTSFLTVYLSRSFSKSFRKFSESFWLAIFQQK